MSARDHITRAARRLSSLAVVLLAWVGLSAHVGTNQVVFEGQAGGYPVRVFIDPPGVVPAQVPILVRVLDGTPARVTVRAAQWNVGTKGAPPPEAVAPVPGDPGVWAHSLWIMTASSYAVYVTVEGPAGSGQVLVPLQTSATRMLGMQQGMGVLLAILGTLLVAGMLTIIGAARREATLPPGEQPTVAGVRRGRVAMIATAALLAVALLGGATWWNAEERAYARRMLRPIAITSRLHGAGDDTRVLTLAITDSLWRTNRYPALLPDHGKLMHLFLVDPSRPEVSLAHLHPLRVHADTFVTRVPMLPAGRYLLFGDLLFQSGATRTLVDTIDFGVASAAAAADSVPAFDGDDAWRTMTPVPISSPAPLPGGASMVLTADGPLIAGRDLRLQVAVRDAAGAAVALEPYMGMAGHAMVVRPDGGVFVHLHPMGTANMTAQAQLQRAERGDTVVSGSAMNVSDPATVDITGMGHDGHTMPTPIGVSAPAFPFAFPDAGEHLVFVQVRRDGAVHTAAFRVTVGPRIASR